MERELKGGVMRKIIWKKPKTREIVGLYLCYSLFRLQTLAYLVKDCIESRSALIVHIGLSEKQRLCSLCVWDERVCVYPSSSELPDTVLKGRKYLLRDGEFWRLFRKPNPRN